MPGIPSVRSIIDRINGKAKKRNGQSSIPPYPNPTGAMTDSDSIPQRHGSASTTPVSRPQRHASFGIADARTPLQTNVSPYGLMSGALGSQSYHGTHSSPQAFDSQQTFIPFTLPPPRFDPVEASATTRQPDPPLRSAPPDHQRYEFPQAFGHSIVNMSQVKGFADPREVTFESDEGYDEIAIQAEYDGTRPTMVYSMKDAASLENTSTTAVNRFAATHMASNIGIDAEGRDCSAIDEVEPASAQPYTPVDPWTNATIDPNELYQSFQPFETSVVMESSKDGLSGLNRDVSEGVGLDINLDILDEKDLPFQASEPNYGFWDDMVYVSGLDNPFPFDSNFFPVDTDKDLMSTQPCRNWRSMIPTPENTRKVLRVFIRNKEHIACPDSGSEQNIMSKAFAKENGLEITRNTLDIKPFELGSGKKVWSVGRVKTTIELIGKSIRRRLRFFYVFPTCPVQLILGMALLNEAEILTKNRHMLEPCPAGFFNISALLWIGSPRKRRRSPCNRMKCTLDGRQLMAIADTGSDQNFMCPNCAGREGFYVDTSEEARMNVQVGDGTIAETIGQVNIHDLSLDWRKPVTETPIPAPTIPTDSSFTEDEQPVSFGTIFHVLPGLPCDVILGRDTLDRTDAFNRCSEQSCTRTSSKRPYELNIIISGRKWPWKRKRTETAPDPKEDHDNKRHEEMYRRSKRADEISLLTGNERNRAQTGEDALCREWDAGHAACTDCHPPNPA